MMQKSVAAWLIGDDTGSSSIAILAYMEGGALAGRDYPRDPADLRRCLHLLSLAPQYRARLQEMAQASPQWARLVARWRDLEALYREEYATGTAPKCYALMQELIGDRNER